MPISAKTFRTAIVGLFALLPVGVHAEGIDTEHIFGFMIGSDVGTVGEREFQSQTTGSFGRTGGRYRAVGQELELEFLPANNFRIEMGTTFAAHDINGVLGFDDRRQLAWQGVSVDLRYRFLDKDKAPFGMTFAVETHADRVDETTAAVVRNYGTEFTLAVDREVIPNVAVAALNLTYQPEWTRFVGTGAAEQESTIGAAFALMAQVRPGVFLGGEARYFRRYDGIGLEEFSGQAFFVGPTAYFQLSERSRLTASWSVQAWGRPAGSNAALDLVNFERHQARLVFGVNF
jgi:opacity protein-like surface antigen